MKNLCATAAVLVLIALTGCSSSSDDGGQPQQGNNNPPPTSNNMVTAALGTSVKNVLIQPNQETRFQFTYQVPAGLLSEPLTAYESFSVDLAATMQNVRITAAPVASVDDDTFDPWRILQRVARSDLFGRLIGIEKALAAVDVSMTVFVSFAGDPDVCDRGAQFGPFEFSGDVDEEPTSDTAVATTESAGPEIDVVSEGAFELCVVIAPLAIPMDAYLTVDEVEVMAEPCDETPPADTAVLGSWSGTYTCTNFLLPDEVNLPITLSISKNLDGSYKYIDDGGAEYDGHFCGDAFRFNGGLSADYSESGTFLLESPGRASKKSIWTGVGGVPGGTCVDDLTKD